MAKILLLGGTGAMGKHLSTILTHNSENIVYVTTRKSNYKNEGNLRYLIGNALDQTFMDEIFAESWDCIVDFMVYSSLLFKNRIDKLLKSTKQYIFISSSRVYAESSDALIETSPRLLDVCQDKDYIVTDEYALMKARCENVLVSMENKNWTIVRPYITYSEQRLQLGELEKEEWLFRALSHKTVVFSKSISEKKTTITYGLDVAIVLSNIIMNNNSYGQIYQITADESCRWKDVIDIYFYIIEDVMGFRPKIQLLEKNCIKSKAKYYQIKYDRNFDRYFNNKKIKESFESISFHTIKEGLDICLRKFLMNPDFKMVDWKWEAVLDRMTGEIEKPWRIKGVKQKVKYYLYRFGILKYKEIK